MMMMSKLVSAMCQSRFLTCAVCRSERRFLHGFKLVGRRLARRQWRRSQTPVQHAIPDIAFDPGHHEQRSEPGASDRCDELPEEIAAGAVQGAPEKRQPDRIENDKPGHCGGDPRPPGQFLLAVHPEPV